MHTVPCSSPPEQPLEDNPLIQRFAKLAAELGVVLPSERMLASSSCSLAAHVCALVWQLAARRPATCRGLV